jgi:ATP-binding cassette subfamily B protein
MKLMHLLGEHRREIVLLTLASSSMLALEALFHPILIMLIFDEGVIQGNFQRFLLLVTTYLLLGLILNVGHLRLSLWGKSLDNRLVEYTSRRMLEVYYQKDYTSILAKGEGYFLSRIYNDVVEGLVPLVTLVREMVSKTVMLVVFLGVLFYLSWQATLFLVSVIPFAAYLSIRLGMRIREITSLEREHEGAFLSVLNRALASFKVVRGFALFPKTVQVYDGKLNAHLSASYQNYRVASIYRAFSSVAMNIADFLALFVGALFVLRGALSFGGYLAFVNAFWRAVTTMMDLLHPIADLHRLLGIVDRLYDFETERAKRYYQVGRNVILKDVSFSYNALPVLENYSLQIGPGEKVVITGPNGSGKTTLANILSGHLAPQQGECHLPKRISSTTLPLAFPPLQVKDLVDDAMLLEEFDLGKVMDETADELSAGQKQKLAVALALSHDADLYVFDEPLASVDTGTTSLLMRRILERTRGKTLIVIMHGWQEFYGSFDKVLQMRHDVSFTVGVASGSLER